MSTQPDVLSELRKSYESLLISYQGDQEVMKDGYIAFDFLELARDGLESWAYHGEVFEVKRLLDIFSKVKTPASEEVSKIVTMFYNEFMVWHTAVAQDKTTKDFEPSQDYDGQLKKHLNSLTLQVLDHMLLALPTGVKH